MIYIFMAFSNKYLNIYSSNETRKNKLPVSLIVAFVYIYFKISGERKLTILLERTENIPI